MWCLALRRDGQLKRRAVHGCKWNLKACSEHGSVSMGEGGAGGVEGGQRKLGREEGWGMGWVRTGIGRSLRCGINNCVPAPARRRRRRRGALAAAVISVDRQANLACQCLYVNEGGAGRGMKGLVLRRRTPRRHLPSAARRDRQTGAGAE
jgi:hypothetical protein